MGGSYGSGKWPQRIGYQHVAEVVQCGSNISQFAVGDIVFTGHCHGHVQYYLAKENNLVVKLPEGLDHHDAAMMGVASVSFHDARRGQVSPEDNVVVFGAGLIGQFAAQAARVRGATVTVADRHADRLELAGELGADAVVDLSDEAGYEQLAARKPYSVIFECCGGDVLDRIIGKPGQGGLVARRSHARLIMVAARWEVTYNFNAAGAAELSILHTQHFDQIDLDQVVRLVVRGTIATRPLIREMVPFNDAVRIYDTLRDNPGQLLGTVFDYSNLD
jgi:threonine dehydrogenase-like Zn-dependent dehydrogenase